MYFDSRTGSIERSPRKRNVNKKYRYIILHPWGKGINFPIKVRMRTALRLKFYQLSQRMCLVTMLLMVLDYKHPITSFYLLLREDPRRCTFPILRRGNLRVSIFFLIYRRFLN